MVKISLFISLNVLFVVNIDYNLLELNVIVVYNKFKFKQIIL